MSTKQYDMSDRPTIPAPAPIDAKQAYRDAAERNRRRPAPRGPRLPGCERPTIRVMEAVEVAS